MIANQEAGASEPAVLTVDEVIAPMSRERFFAEYWNTKALYFPGDAGRFTGLFDRASFNRAVYDCIDLKTGYTDEKGWPAFHKITPEQVGEIYASGKTVCASQVNRGDRNLQAFLNRWQADFALVGDFFFNSYLSPDGAGFGLHIDTHSVWILQLEGQKRWRFSRAPRPRRVITNVSMPADRTELKLPWGLIRRPNEGDLEEVVLRPGDALYLPKGTWHQAGAVGSSLALTLAEPYATPLQLIQTILAKQMAHCVPLLDGLPALPKSDVATGLPPVFRQDLEEGLAALRQMVNAITADELYQVWKSLL